MNILVVDDHPLVREALRAVSFDLGSNSSLYEAGDSRQARQLIRKHKDVRLVLLDLRLPDGDGFGLLAELRELHPDIAIVILSGADDPISIVKAFALGAVGFLRKSDQREVMMGALRLVASEGQYLAPQTIERGISGAETQLARQSRSLPPGIELTDRQLEVLSLIMKGKSNKAICRVLNLAEPTVKNHVTAILRALKVTNRTEAAISARDFGWSLTPAERRPQ
jgi:DNA-binding NarL/FixJ family response regulator